MSMELLNKLLTELRLSMEVYKRRKQKQVTKEE